MEAKEYFLLDSPIITVNVRYSTSVKQVVSRLARSKQRISISLQLPMLMDHVGHIDFQLVEPLHQLIVGCHLASNSHLSLTAGCIISSAFKAASFFLACSAAHGPHS